MLQTDLAAEDRKKPGWKVNRVIQSKPSHLSGNPSEKGGKRHHKSKGEKERKDRGGNTVESVIEKEEPSN